MRIDKDNIKIILILLVVALGIGYSYLNTDLAINGTANINSANWNVYWNNVQVSNGSVEATTPTIEDMRIVAEGGKQTGENLKGLYEDLNGMLEEFDLYDQASKNLSALQQGIQGITEDTAGALEAYMNGVSQQVYAQTEYLRQIAEVMTRDDNPNDDVKVASLSQLLLQLQ